MDPIFFCEKQTVAAFYITHASPKYRSFGSSLDNYVKSSKKKKSTYGFNDILRLTKNMNPLFTHKSLQVHFQGDPPAKVKMWSACETQKHKKFTAASNTAPFTNP